MINDPNMESHNKNRQSVMVIETMFCSRTTRGEGGLRCHFSEIGKKCPNFEKNSDCGHLWVKFLI